MATEARTATIDAEGGERLGIWITNYPEWIADEILTTIAESRSLIVSDKYPNLEGIAVTTKIGTARPADMLSLFLKNELSKHITTQESRAIAEELGKHMQKPVQDTSQAYR